MTPFFIILGLLGIGLIIFIHEAGHFVAAKKVGIRVERFALGFDPWNLRLFSFKKGETEYVLGMIPFGGYVKLAGEALAEQGKKPAPDELLAQSVGARAVVFAAGAVMNIISAVFLFVIAFSFGVMFPEPKIGNVLPGSPAWEAGLQAGDTLLEINGKEVNDFQELVLAAALSGQEETLQLKVRRGKGEEIDFPLKPRWDPARGIHSIGVRASLDPVLNEPPSESVAAEAGLQAGDRVVGIAIAGKELPATAPNLLIEEILKAQIIFLPSFPFKLKVLRGDEEKWVELRMRRTPDAEPVALLQVSVGKPFTGTLVQAIAPGSGASQYLRPGDRVLKVNGQHVGTLHWLHLLENFTPGPLAVELQPASGEPRTEQIDYDELLAWNLRHEILWTEFRARIGALAEGAPLRAAGVEEGDVILALGDSPLYAPDELPGLLQKQAGPTLKVKLRRGANEITIEVDRKALEEPAASFGCAARDSGIRWRDFPSLSYVAPAGPAGKAGITPGSRILRIGEKDIFSWADLQSAVQDAEPGQVEVEWVTASGERLEKTLTPAAPLYEDPGLAFTTLKKEVSAGLLGSAVLGAERTVLVAKQVFLTLRSLIRRDVSAKNLSGPVGITHVFTIVAEMGLVQLIYWMAIVSVNLGLLNLLPFPILDGGHLFFLLIEKIKGSPVDVRVQEWAMRVAFLLIISLALFVTFHDIRRLIAW
jgi:regulator of sigma E protease